MKRIMILVASKRFSVYQWSYILEAGREFLAISEEKSLDGPNAQDLKRKMQSTYAIYLVPC